MVIKSSVGGDIFQIHFGDKGFGGKGFGGKGFGGKVFGGKGFGGKVFGGKGFGDFHTREAFRSVHET